MLASAMALWMALDPGDNGKLVTPVFEMQFDWI